MKTTLTVNYPCLLCKKDIDDYGDNFCSKCRIKDWKLRFMAIAKAEKLQALRNQRGKIHFAPKTYAPRGTETYWERRRGNG